MYYTHVYMYMNTYIYLHIYVYIHMCVHIHIHMHTNMYIPIFSFVHEYTYLEVSRWWCLISHGVMLALTVWATLRCPCTAILRIPLGGTFKPELKS